MGFTDLFTATLQTFGLGKRKTEEEAVEQSPAKKSRAAGHQQQQGMPNAQNGYASQLTADDPADCEIVTNPAAVAGQQAARLSQQQQQHHLPQQLPAHAAGRGTQLQQHLQQQEAQHTASTQLFGSLAGFNSARGYEHVRNTLAQPPTATQQHRAAHGAHNKPVRRMPMVSQQGVTGSGRGPAPTPTRQWFGRMADSSNQSPAMFRISPLTGPEHPRVRQTGSYGSMGPPPQQHPQQQLLQQQHQCRPYAGRQAAEVQRTSRPLQSYAVTAAGGRGGAAAPTAAAAGRGRALLAAPAATAGHAAAAAGAAAADGVWRRSASPPLQQVAQRLFGADIGDESGHTASGWTGPSGLAAAARGAGAVTTAAAAAAGAGTSQLTPPARFDAVLNTTLAELGAAAAVHRDSAFDQKEAAALARAAKAQAMLDKAMQRSKEAKKHSQQVMQRIDNHLLAQISPDYKANPAAHEAWQQLQEATIQHNLQRQLQEQRRLQEMQQQRQQAAERIAKQHAAAAAALPRLPAMPAWQRRPPQQQQEEEEGGDDDEVVIVSSDEEEGGSNQEQYPDEVDGSVVSEHGSEYESDEEAESESEEAEAAAAELGALGINAWLAPRANWSCTQQQMSRYTAITQGPGDPEEKLVSHARSNLDLTRYDLSTLKPMEWLNDECMNMYMALLQDRDIALRSNGGLSCHFFNTFFLNKLYVDEKQYNYKNVRRWTLPARLKGAGLAMDCVLKCDRVIIPVHEGNHWTALMVDVKAQRLVFFDSLMGENRRAVIEVKRWVADEAKDKLKEDWDISGWLEVYPRDIPRQANGVDCGVFALMFCNRMGLRGGAFDFRQEDISVNVRVAITHDLLEGKIQLSGKRS